MPFQKGNKFGRGGRQNPPGGRPTNEERAAKESMRRAALDTLANGIVEAVGTLLKHLGSEHENISLRAAQSIIEYAIQAHQIDQVEARIAAIEAKIEGRH